MTTDLFENSTDNAIDPEKNYFEELVGEGKKFSDAAALARGKVEADAFIETIKQENDALRRELQARANFEEMLDKLSKNSLKGEDDQSDQNKGENPPSAPTTPEDIAKLVNDQLQAAREKERREANLQLAKAELEKVYGRDYPTKLKAKAEELGVGVQFLNDMAAKTPKAFLELVSPVRDRSTGITPPSGIVPPTSGRTGVKNYAYYQKLQKENPALRSDAKFQRELLNEAMRQGSNFYA